MIVSSCIVHQDVNKKQQRKLHTYGASTDMHFAWAFIRRKNGSASTDRAVTAITKKEVSIVFGGILMRVSWLISTL